MVKERNFGEKKQERKFWNKKGDSVVRGMEEKNSLEKKMKKRNFRAGEIGKERKFGKKALFFLIKFFAVYTVLQAVILIAPLETLKEWIALIEANALGLNATGNKIGLNSHSFEIVANCTGLMSSAVLAAIAFGLKGPEAKKKILLVGIGGAALFLINLLRIYLVLLAAIVFNPRIAEMLHTGTWFAMAAGILFIWHCLTKRIAGAKAFSEML